EIGRGTSTFDGLSLAWACATYLAESIKAYTLFATHYFELTHLEETTAQVRNVHLNATEHGDQIIFLHAVKEGPANQSYGLQLAQLAGVPQNVIRCAKKKLQELENQNIITQRGMNEFRGGSSGSVRKPYQASLFEETIPPALKKLQSIDPNQLT